MLNYLTIIVEETYKILFLLVPILVAVALVVWLDRRVWAFVQKRRGPNVVGPFGLFQSLADALKEALNVFLEDKEGFGGVEGIHFTSFVLQ